MRFRIGLLQDTKEIEKQIAKDAAEARKPPTVKTEAETKRDEARVKDPERGKLKATKPKIKPLPEAKAIELGANFVSETFLLAVGIALILFENARRGRQETKKDEGQIREIEELKRTIRLQTQGLIEMEKEILKPRSKDATLVVSSHRILPKELREPEEEGNGTESRARGWLSWVPSLLRTDNKEGSQSKESASIEQDAKLGESAPTASPGMLSRIIPRNHWRDVKPKSTKHPVDPSSTYTAFPASGPPEETLFAASKTK